MNEMKNFILCLILFGVTQIHARSINQNHQIALVDTGYDACNFNGKNHSCELNQNLLFRGELPLQSPSPKKWGGNYDVFINNIWSYLTLFKRRYHGDNKLPNNITDLKKYRIVIVSLLYGLNAIDNQNEKQSVIGEFQYINTGSPVLPKQHHIYNLNTPYDAKQYAFEWWPINLRDKGVFSIFDSPNTILNSPVTLQSSKGYLPMNFMNFIDGEPLDNAMPNQSSMALTTLLKYIPRDGHPLLIFYHCRAGKDRTGAVTMSYYMKYGGYPHVGIKYGIDSPMTQILRKPPMTYRDALQTAVLFNNEPNSRAKKLARTYCLAINRSTGISKCI
jgi:hypothetical protein